MNRKLLIVLLIFCSGFLSAQQDDLYDHGLDEKKWNELRGSIRYEQMEKEGPGKEWTYDSKQDYERAKKDAAMKKGGGSGTGGSGDGGSYRSDDYNKTEWRDSTPRTKLKMGNMPNLSWLGYVLMGLLILALVFLIYYLLVNRERTGKKVVPLNLEETAPTEIPLTELQKLLQDAIAKGDYRGAVRIYFIFILRGLSERNWIKWEKEKTNFHYLREMTDRSEYKDFNKTVSFYEIIWYGKREIDESTFKQIKPDFTILLDKLDIK